MILTTNKTPSSLNHTHSGSSVRGGGLITSASRGEKSFECFKIYERVIDELTINLNSYHKIHWNKEQYRKLLGNWVLHFIRLVQWRWENQHNQIIERCNEIQIKIQSDYEEINYYNWDIDLNNNLFKIIKYVYQYGKIPQLDIYEVGSALNCFSIDGYKKEKLIIDQPYFGLCHNVLERIEVNEYFKKTQQFGNVVDWKFGQKINYKINHKWRKNCVRKKIKNFSDLCIAICQIYLPVCFLEGFEPLHKMALSYEFLNMYTPIGAIWNIPLKMVAATWHGNSKIFTHQHGGGYGMSLMHINEFYEISISEKFFTWGWQEDKKTLPLTGRPRIIKQNKRNGILIKTKPNHRYSNDFFSHSINETIKFITLTKNLNREISHYRTQPGQNLDINYFVRLKYKLENAEIPDKTKNDGLYSLHVLNYMGSAFLESMAANIPTICIIDEKNDFFREDFSKYVNAFEDVGVIHTNGESASDKVKEIYYDIDTWWEDDEIQNIRKIFTQKYARLNSQWIDELCQQFQNIVN